MSPALNVLSSHKTVSHNIKTSTLLLQSTDLGRYEGTSGLWFRPTKRILVLLKTSIFFHLEWLKLWKKQTQRERVGTCLLGRGEGLIDIWSGDGVLSLPVTSGSHFLPKGAGLLYSVWTNPCTGFNFVTLFFLSGRSSYCGTAPPTADVVDCVTLCWKLELLSKVQR